ncbi:MAG TPA: histidine phosphatase family protein [Sphingomonas sp.]|nr:histidine phosphatase family protein [Sphingomonas sp.]
MKRLITFRHAKSGWDQPSVRDFDRALNDKGKRAAATMGRHLRGLGLGFDAVIASPAVRVAESLDALFDGYGRRFVPAWDRRVYLGSAANLLEVLHDAPDTADAVLLAGHNPGIEELVLLLAATDGEEQAATRGSVGEKYPTASVAELELPIDRWADLAPAAGRLLRFIRPRDLDPALGPDVL